MGTKLERRISREWIWAGLIFTAVVTLFTLEGLISGFLTTGDLFNTMFAIVHYKQSISQGEFPLYTNLWYGGRPQYLNPFWSFLYLPATVVWLLFSLETGSKIVVVGHVVPACLVGYAIASKYLVRAWHRFVAGFLFGGLVFIRIGVGQTDYVMAWTWVLILVYCFIQASEATSARLQRRYTFFAGLSLGVIPLTGAIYYTVYALILFTCLLGALTWISGDWKVPIAAGLGASVGLLHLPSVWYLLGGHGLPVVLQVSAPQLAQTLFIWPVREPFLHHESWALIGVTMIPFIVVAIMSASWEVKALAPAIVLFVALATGWLYHLPGFEWLSIMRTASRVAPFVALVLLLWTLIGIQRLWARGIGSRVVNFLLVASMIQVTAVVLLEARPVGSADLESSGANKVAAFLKRQGAKSVWTAVPESIDTKSWEKIGLALNQKGIATPNVYTGTMGQTVPTNGPYAGWSFDWLVVTEPVVGERQLRSAVLPRAVLATIGEDELEFVTSFTIWEQSLHVFREGRLQPSKSFRVDAEAYLYRVRVDQ